MPLLENPSESKKYPFLPLDSANLENRTYIVSKLDQIHLEATSNEIVKKVWFKTPPLDSVTIDRIYSIQLEVESRDQGQVDDRTKGNWTWFEISIFKKPSDLQPRRKGEVTLTWRSYENRFDKQEFYLCEGQRFNKEHDMFNLLEPGNVLGVRVCARFTGWHILAKNGYLVIGIGDKLDRKIANLERIKKEKERIRDVLISFDKIRYITDKNATDQNGTDAIEVDANNTYKNSNQNGNSTENSYKTWIDKALDKLDIGEIYEARETRPLRVLCLDGGGVRGIASLIMLEDVMRKMAPEGGEPPKPCEVFDMIGGTSTGGLIAIMLGVLKMDIRDCIKMYENVMRTIFPPGKLGFVEKCLLYTRNVVRGNGGGTANEEALEAAVKRLVTEKKLGVDTKMLVTEGELKVGEKTLPDKNDEQANKYPCKVFVVSVYKGGVNNTEPLLFRSYRNKWHSQEVPEATIWQVARATSAAPLYFPSIKIGDKEFVDGGLGANNPIGWLWIEVMQVFGLVREIDCFLSIGTGMPSNKGIPNFDFNPLNWRDATSAIAGAATNAQINHILFRPLVNAFSPKTAKPKYWRLNVDEPTGKDKVTALNNHVDLGNLDDVAEIETLRQLTGEYLNRQAPTIVECADVLRASIAAAKEKRRRPRADGTYMAL